MWWIIIICIAWYAIGVLSFVYWWTKDYDFTHGEIFLAFLLGFGGPFIWPMGKSFHGNDAVIVKKRKK